MSRLWQSAVYGGLFAAVGGSVYLTYSIVFCLTTGGNLLDIAINGIIGALTTWLVLTALFFSVLGKVAKFNQEARKRFEDKQKSDKDKDDKK